MSLINELKRRNVIRVALAYGVIAWVILQILDVVVGVIDAPAWVLQIAFFIGLIGLVPVVIFSWVYELTPEGIRKESEIDRSRSITSQTGRKLDRVIIVFLGVAVVVLLADRFIHDEPPAGSAEMPQTASAPAEQTDAPAETHARSMAVLPFVAMSRGDDDEYFADGLTEEILNSLAQLPELRVTARTSAFAFKGQDVPVDEIASRLGVKYIVEGSVRRSGERLRVTAQLIRASDGFHLWSDTYDSTSQDAIAVQEDIAEKIAISLNVVLDDSKRQAMQLAGLRDVEAFTAYQKARYHYWAAHGEMEPIPALREANALFEEVLERVPEFSQAYVDHSDLYAHILLDNLAGFPTEGVTQEEIDSAADHAVRDFDKAIQYAANPRERLSYEYDRAFLSGEWQGLSSRIARVFNDAGCVNNNWMSLSAPVLGFEQEYVAFARVMRDCDPLVSLEWYAESRGLMWAGKLEESLAVAQQGYETAPGGWLNLQTVYALVALGRFEEAERVVVTRSRNQGESSVSRMLIAAGRGDRDLMTRHYTDYREAEGSKLWAFQYYVWSGEQEMANAIAAELDADPNFHYALTVFTIWCACGAPFPPEATPNFTHLLKTSGLNWPPPTPIKFPLQSRN